MGLLSIKFCMVTEESNIFYKYRRIDDEGNTIKMLENQEFYFSSSSEFNDPFDSKVDLIWRAKKDGWIHFLSRMGIKNRTKCEQIIKENLNNGVLKNKKDEYLLNPNKIAFKALKEKVQINDKPNYPRACCFSKDNDSILMWSHYADEHKGICFCFRSKRIENGDFLFLDSDPDPHLFFPIIYQEGMPKQVNMLSNYEPEELVAFLRTKHFNWEYENEYRLIMWPTDFERKDKFTKKFRKQDLEGIIFGLNTPIEDIKRIYEIVCKNYHEEGFRVNFYKAQEIPKKYALHIKKIDRLDQYLKKYGK